MDAPPINSDTSMADINTLRLKGKTVTLTYCEGYPANEMMGILTGPDWEHEIAPADWRYVVAKRAQSLVPCKGSSNPCTARAGSWWRGVESVTEPSVCWGASNQR